MAAMKKAKILTFQNLIYVSECIGALAGVCFHLQWVRGKETLERWHTRVTLRNLNVVGFVSAVTGVTALIWYLFLTFYYKIRKHIILDHLLYIILFIEEERHIYLVLIYF